MPILTCPKCATPMLELYRDGISVDVCPICGGAWLDRGELERLRQRGTTHETTTTTLEPAQERPERT